MKNTFIKLFIVLLAVAFSGSIFAQKKNLIKLNLLSPILRTGNLQFEHAIGEKSSLQLGFYYTGYKISDTKFSGWGITPEYRMYFSESSSAPAGFFIAPFLRYQSFTLKANDTMSGTEAEATLSSIRPGVCIGYQFIFSEKVSFEFFIGPSYSSSNLKVKSGTESDFSFGAFDGFGLRSGITIGIAF